MIQCRHQFYINLVEYNGISVRFQLNVDQIQFNLDEFNFIPFGFFERTMQSNTNSMFQENFNEINQNGKLTVDIYNAYGF